MTYAIVVLSGGMDSTAALYWARTRYDQTDAVSVNYGQRHAVELSYATRTCASLGVRHDVIDASTLGLVLSSSALTGDTAVPEGAYDDPSMAATVVPNRNAILLNLVGGIAVSREADAIVTGVHAGDHPVYPDCRPEFIDAMRHLLSVANTHQVAVEAPFVNVPKDEIARIGTELGVDWSSTWSCYNGGDTHCGRCGTCVERAEAFALAGVADPTVYQDEGFWRQAVGSV